MPSFRASNGSPSRRSSTASSHQASGSSYPATRASSAIGSMRRACVEPASASPALPAPSGSAAPALPPSGLSPSRFRARLGLDGGFRAAPFRLPGSVGEDDAGGHVHEAGLRPVVGGPAQSLPFRGEDGEGPGDRPRRLVDLPGHQRHGRDHLRRARPADEAVGVRRALDEDAVGPILLQGGGQGAARPGPVMAYAEDPHRRARPGGSGGSVRSLPGARARPALPPSAAGRVRARDGRGRAFPFPPPPCVGRSAVGQRGRGHWPTSRQAR